MSRRFIAAFSLIASCGCGSSATDNLPEPTRTCSGGLAEILVMDGPIQRLCGCDEGRGEPESTGIRCTIPLGTDVVFHFLGSKMRHQIMPDGPLTAPETGMVEAVSPVRDAVAGFLDRGAYPFRDAFAPTASGTIVVR